MNRYPGCARPHQRQHEVRGVQKIYLVLSENPGKLYLLPNRVVCQFGSYDFALVLPAEPSPLAGGRINRYAPLGLLSQDCLNQALHIPANAGILILRRSNAIFMDSPARSGT